MRRLVAGIVLPLLLSTAACGGGSSNTEDTTQAKVGTVADISVTGPTDAQPEVSYKPPLAFDKTAGEIVKKGPGSGDPVAANSSVTVNYEFLNASNNEVVDSSWDAKKPATFQLSSVLPGLVQGLLGAHAGDRVLVAIAPEDGLPNGNGTTVREGDSLIVVADLIRVSTPEPLTDSELPTLQLDDKKMPTGFAAQPKTPATLDTLGVNVLEKGTGPPVTAGQTLTVEYLGQVYPDGKVFDESYSKPDPVSFSLTQVIPGWQQGLVGQPVGSRVVLTIPSALGYGAAGQGKDIPPNADLVFVIDIETAS